MDESASPHKKSKSSVGKLTGSRLGRLLANQQMLQALDHNHVLALLDGNGRLLETNDRFAVITGIATSRLHELSLPDIFTIDGEHYSAALLADVLVARQVWHGSLCCDHARAGRRWLDVTLIPLVDEQGDAGGFSLFGTDVSNVRQRVDDTLLRVERAELGQKFAEIGTWDWDIQTGDLYWSDQIGPLFGYRDEVPETTYENFLAAVHPDDRQAVIDAVSDCVERGVKYEIEHRVIWRDGTERWVLERGDVIRDMHGFPLHMLGVVQDITRRKQMEQSLQTSRERLEEAQRLAAIGNWEWRLDQDNLWWSDEIYRIFGYEPGEFAPSIEAFFNAVHPDDVAAVRASEARARQGEQHDVEHRILLPDGSERVVHERGEMLFDSSGQPVIMRGTVQDITESRRKDVLLKQQAMLLSVLRDSVLAFVASQDLVQAADSMLNGLLELTGSEFGFTGEVLHDDAGQPYLRTHALTNITWDEASRRFYEENAEGGLEFHNLDTLFGQTLRTGDMLISNEPGKDPRATGIPHGHPPLHSFISVPIYYGDEMVGMYGLANRGEGYDEAMAEFLRPVNATYGTLIRAKRLSSSEDRVRQELVAAKDEAEQANLAKSEFLSRMSHELRTPLNAILGFGQLLGMDELKPEQETHVQEILRAGRHLLELINEILDLAKIEAGRIDLSLEETGLEEVIGDCCSLLVPMAEQRSVKVVTTAEYAGMGSVKVLADRTRLKQVVLNLLSNAIKYGHEGGTVTLDAVFRPGGLIRVSVIDDGPGIPRDRQHQLFQAFSRLGDEQDEIEGTGIGLLITRRLVEYMGGKVGFSSEPGNGSEFWFELPQALAVAQREPNEQSEQTRQGDIGDIVDSSAHILYIEDNPANMRLMQSLLSSKSNIELTVAGTPEEGLAVALSRPVDLILLDINLPGMDGYELLEQIRSRLPGRSIPVIAVSAAAMPEEIERGRRAGLDDYLTKPLDVSRFFEILERHL